MFRFQNYTELILLGAAALLIYAGQQLDNMMLRQLGGMVFGVIMILGGWFTIRRRSARVRGAGNITTQYSGFTAIAWGLMRLLLGLTLVVATGLALVGMEQVAIDLITARPGVFLIPIGVVVALFGTGEMVERKSRNDSPLRTIASLPSRLIGLLFTLVGVALVALGVWAFSNPEAFLQIVADFADRVQGGVVPE